MNRAGFTLVEVIITMAILTILLSFATFQFQAFTRKAEVESQTRKLYANMMELRSSAIFSKRDRAMKMAASSYSIYSSSEMSVNPVETISLRIPIQWNSTGEIIFDTRGLMDNDSSICVSESNSASVDSVVISTTRIKIGKREGASCASANVISK